MKLYSLYQRFANLLAMYFQMFSKKKWSLSGLPDAISSSSFSDTKLTSSLGCVMMKSRAKRACINSNREVTRLTIDWCRLTWKYPWTNSWESVNCHKWGSFSALIIDQIEVARNMIATSDDVMTSSFQFSFPFVSLNISKVDKAAAPK